jgi:hypothetical protein
MKERRMGSGMSRRVIAAMAAIAMLPTVSVLGWGPSAAIAAPAATTKFVQLPPTRVLDTRRGLGGVTGPVAPGATFRVQIAGQAGIPAEATSVAMNLTAVEAARPGFITLYPAGGSRPNTSNVNPTSAGHTVANMAIVTLGAGGAIDAFVEAGGHVLMDVAGYWVPATTATSGRFVPITPIRTLDTRQTAKVAPSGTINAVVAGVNSIPIDASAVAVTVTAVDATRGGFVTAWAAGAPRPDASISNQPAAGSTVPNTTIVPVGAGGQISVYTDGGAHILVDIAGWFTGTSAPDSTDGLFVPVSPVRIADSRSSQAIKKLAAGLTAELPLTIPGGVPAGMSAAAVAANLTVTSPMDGGFLTAFPAQVGVPDASNLNFRRSDDVAGLALTRLGANGNLNLYSYSTTEVIVDIAGWFTGQPAADGGFRPTKCENLMQFIRDEGNNQRSVRVSDFVNARGDSWTVASGSVGGRIAQRCEYVFLFRSNPDGRTAAISRIDVLGRQPEHPVTPALSFDTFQPSASGQHLFYLDGGTETRLSRRIMKIDVMTGVSSVVWDSQSYGLYDLTDVSPDGQWLYFTAETSDGRVGPSRINLVNGTRAAVSAGWAHDYEISPNGDAVAAVVFNDDDTSEVEYSGTFQGVRTNVYRVRFTAQGDAVESEIVGSVVKRSPANLTPVILLDDTINYAPNFAEFALK